MMHIVAAKLLPQVLLLLMCYELQHFHCFIDGIQVFESDSKTVFYFFQVAQSWVLLRKIDDPLKSSRIKVCRLFIRDEIPPENGFFKA